MVKNSLQETHPGLAREWHPTKNDGLEPSQITAGSNRVIWWFLPYDDPRTKKHFDFEWQASVKSRTKQKCGCPFLTNKRLWKGYNDLETLHPNLALEWNAEKNGIEANEVIGQSCQKYWWIQYYDDEFTGKRFCFEWEACINHRVSGEGNPYLTGKSLCPGFNDLATRYPEIASQWHPDKNGTLTPDQVFPKSNQTVWWYQKYYDPVLNREFEFEWKTSISSRTSKNLGCPFLSGKSIWPGFNDLATRFPSVAKEWDYGKNGDLTPEQVMPFSMTKVWWIISYTDPDTGKTHTLSWKAAIASRTKGIGCPYFSNKKVLKGLNDLATTHPHLAKQWHPTKNGNLSPEMVSYGSGQTVWWYLEYYDNELDKTFRFEWETSVNARTSKDTGCPYLMNKAVWKGYNDLQTRYPEIAREWDYEKNGDLTPDQIAAASNMEVWWKVPYTDPLSGKTFYFSWRSRVSNRTILRAECPYLTSTALYPGFSDLASRYPEVAAQWHPTRNGELKPDQVFPFDKRSVWWLYPYDDPQTGRHFDFEWKATVAKKVGSKYGCPYLTNDAVWIGFNDLATTHPEVAAQWHPTKNGDLTPQMVTYGSNQLVWWLYPYDDPRTGRHFDFEWSGTVAVRVYSNCDCPYLTNDAVWAGFNDLATTHPEVAAQWHPTKNGELKPEQVTAGSRKLVWWLYPYDDPRTGKHFDFEWRAEIENRAIGENSCPYLANTELYQGFNDLATRYPEVAAQWHPTKNGELKPNQVFPSDQRSVWWLYPYDDPNTGRHFDFEWSSTVAAKVGSKYGCPYLTNDAVWVGFNDLATTHPEVAAQWHPTKNGNLTPEMVTAGSNQLAWWFLPYTDPSTGKIHYFEWVRTVTLKVRSLNDCPYIAGHAVWTGYNDLQSCFPDIAEQWSEKNRFMKPDKVYKFSKMKAWWKCPVCGTEWRTSVNSRTARGTGCPKCAADKRKFWYIY